MSILSNYFCSLLLLFFFNFFKIVIADNQTMARKVEEQLLNHIIDDPEKAAEFVSHLPARASVAEWTKQKATVLLQVLNFTAVL